MTVKKSDSNLKRINMQPPKPAPAFGAASQPTLSALARRSPYVDGFRIHGLMPAYTPRG